MQVSKNKMNPVVKKQIKAMLAQVTADLKNQADMTIFLRDFLTPAENLTLAKRLAIILYLEKGRSYDDICKALKVSSATVAGVQMMLEKQSEGFMLALKHLRAEEWAEEWSAKITKFFQPSLNSKT